MPTVPNQRVVKIHRDMPGEREGNFLLIKKSNLYDAYKNLNATALCLYLYLVGNMNGYNLEFSPKAIHDRKKEEIEAAFDAAMEEFERRGGEEPLLAFC